MWQSGVDSEISSIYSQWLVSCVVRALWYVLCWFLSCSVTFFVSLEGSPCLTADSTRHSPGHWINHHWISSPAWLPIEVPAPLAHFCVPCCFVFLTVFCLFDNKHLTCILLPLVFLTTNVWIHGVFLTVIAILCCFVRSVLSSQRREALSVWLKHPDWVQTMSLP